ncbi:MAG TPA: MFS transporter [Armatimonadota bacterium]|nr:MFS transporter [Armatimonadota bacterium]
METKEAPLGRNRRITTVIAAMLAMFLLGAIYAYGVLLPDIMQSFHVQSSQATLPQSILLFVYAVGMGIGGALQDRTSPTRIAIGGGAAFGLGMLIASRAHGLTLLVLSYGILAGIGFGFAYVSAVTAVMTSFPKHRGTVAGLVVGAFGLGSIVWAPLAQHVLAALGWNGIFFIYGIASLVLLPLLGVGIRTPWHPHETPGEHPKAQGATLKYALHTPLFWTLFAAYTLVTSAGLMWLALFKIFGISQGISTTQAALLVVVTSVGSGTGRIVMGGLSDRIGRFPSLIGASLLAVVVFLLIILGLPHLGIFIAAALIGFAFGTWLALYGPASTDLFGMKAAGAIYGALYLSYGIGGLLGPLLGGYLADTTGNYRLSFMTAAAFCLLGVVLFFIAKLLSRRMYHHPPALDEEFPV